MYGYNNYGGMYPPYERQMGTGGQMPPQCQITRVNGRNGADAYRMAPNSAILLLDENDPIIWLKTTDGAGYATITPYAITPYQPAPPVDLNSLEDRIKRLEEVVNGKSDNAAAV